MPIPGAESAYIEPEKLRGYLLNLAHPVGGPKARWFLWAGYDPKNPDRLGKDLLRLIGESGDYVEERTESGVKYVVRGRLDTPRRGGAEVLTVWAIETDPPRPRLVTAYPKARRRR